MRLGPRSCDLAVARRRAPARRSSGSTIGTSTPSNGWPQLPRFAAGRSGSSGSPQYGPNVSVMPNRLARAPGRRPLLRRAARRPGCRRRSDERSARGEARVGGEPSGLVGPAPEQRDPLALEEGERAVGLGLGLGEQRRAGDEHREQPAAEPARPEERHRDVEALARADAAGPRARRRVARSAPPWVWITPFGAPRLPEVNRIARSSAGPDRALRASATTGRGGLAGGSSSTVQTASERRAGRVATARPRAGDAARARPRRARRGTRGRGTPARRRGASPRRSAAGPRARAVAAAC